MKKIILLLAFLLIALPAYGQYSGEEVNYLCEISLGAEYGSNVQFIKKWIVPLRIKILGNPSKNDLLALEGIINELKSLTDLDIKIAETNHNVSVYFIPENKFKSVLHEYQPLNYGYFWTWWNANYEIYKSVILISTSGISQLEKEHLIREELTQSLGLMNDSPKFHDSIFQSRWTRTTSYSSLDIKLIKMLYNPKIKPGMTKGEVVEILKGEKLDF